MGACFNDNDCTSFPGQDLCTKAVCQANTCVLEPKICPPNTSNPCVARTECNPATGACVEIAVAAGTECRAAQGECDLPAVCVGTTCPDNPLKEAGTVCRAAAGDCDVAEFKENGVPCNRDNDLCTLDTCQNGQCQAGPQKTCPASTDPCKVNVCNPATGDCVTQNAPNGTVCEDGNLCTTGDTCQGGQCQAGPQKTCPASTDPCKVNACVPATGLCVTQNAPNGTVCNDNNLCTTGETCQNGTCQGGTRKTCQPGTTCAPATGTCQCNTGITCVGSTGTITCCTGNQVCCAANTRNAGTCKNANACN